MNYELQIMINELEKSFEAQNGSNMTITTKKIRNRTSRSLTFIVLLYHYFTKNYGNL